MVFFLYMISQPDINLKNQKNWLEELERNANSQVLKILIGNGCDLEERREIRKDEGEAFAMKKKQLIKISAKKMKH